jgi:hypothetical protein
MADYMGKMVDKSFKYFVNTKAYKQGSINEKRVSMGKYFKDIRKTAKKRLVARHPKLAVKVDLGGLSTDKKELLKEKLGRKVKGFLD